MLRKGLLTLGLVAMLASAGCNGMRDSGTTFTTHAESFRILGFAIPEDDQAAAAALVPQGATITNVSSTPADWTSLWGFFGNLFWFHWTTIGGTK